MTYQSNRAGSTSLPGTVKDRTWLLDLEDSTTAFSVTMDGASNTGWGGAIVGGTIVGRTDVTARFITAHLGSGSDQLNLTDISGDVFTGEGNDTINLIRKDLYKVRMVEGTINGEGGIDTLNVDFSSSNGPWETHNARFSSNGTGGFDGWMDSYSSIASIERLNVKFGTNDDSFAIDAASLLKGARVSVDAGEGVDRLDLDLSALERAAVVASADGVVRIAGAQFKGFESFHIVGTAGNDVLKGGSGNDYLVGGAGNDRLWATGGNDTLAGGLGDDTYYIDDTSGWVEIRENADEGLDTIISTGSAPLFGANVEKLILTGNASATIYGNALDNMIIGNAGDNELFGGDGNDVIHGGGGNDTFVGGLGTDTLIGGLGSDQFILDLDTSATRDLIRNFEHGKDKLVLQSMLFEALPFEDRPVNEFGLGSVKDSEFIIGTKALTAEQHLIYDQTRGALFYDADGSGREASVMIAIFDNKPTITVQDFAVVI